jgi:two-component system, NtrC family, response regulator
MKTAGVSTAEEALQVMEFSSLDILLTDLRLPGVDGLELLKKVSVAHPDTAVVMLAVLGAVFALIGERKTGSPAGSPATAPAEELLVRAQSGEDRVGRTA